MPELSRNATVLVVDAMDLRRAGIVSLLAPWADFGGLELVSLTPDEAANELDTVSNCRMLIFGFGGESVLSRRNLRHMQVLRALVPDIPLIVVSDNMDPNEVAAALKAGAQGFIHTDVTPELAMKAFSFILSGGSYFPTSAVRQLRSRAEQGRDSPLGPSHISRFGSDRVQHLHGVNADYGSPDDVDARQKAMLKPLCHDGPSRLIAHRHGLTEGTPECFSHAPVAFLSNSYDKIAASASMPRKPPGFPPSSIPVEVANTAQNETPGLEPIKTRSSGTRKVGGAEKDVIPKKRIDLTPREKDVLAALELGLSNKLIAARLNLSESTVKMHIGQIIQKCSARNRTEALLFWIGRLPRNEAHEL
jgi:DNA-binding NarL/FixJ family response regulator